AGGDLTAKRAPRRPGTAPAPGLRARAAASNLPQTALGKETPLMWFRSIRKAPRPGFRRRTRRSPPGQPPPKLPVEALADRTVPAFLTAVNYSVGSFPQAVAVGHFNADTTLDLVVANYSSSTISVLLGNSDGTFQAAQSYPTGSGPRSVAVGDFDG